MTDTLDRDERLETLLRTTFENRARTVDDGPEWTGSAPSRRHGWLAIAAVVALVLTLAVGGAVWRGRAHHTPAAGDAAKATEVALPAAWQAALHGQPLRVDGQRVFLNAMTADGDSIVSLPHASGAPDRFAVVSADGVTRGLYAARGTDQLTHPSTDGRWVVFAEGVAPEVADGTRPAYVTARAIDLQDGTDRVITDGVLPAGYFLSDDPQVLDGVAYLAVLPLTERNADEPTGGLIIAVDLTTGEHRIVGHTFAFSSPSGDPRGVFWAGGGVATNDVPASAPPFTAAMNQGRNVVHNGSVWAWDVVPNGSTVAWFDGTTTRSWDLADIATGAHADLSYVAAVAGPFVFVATANGPSSLFVLDTRTGAYAPTGLDALPVLAQGSEVAVTVAGNGADEFETLRLQTNGLPGLTP